jgi:ABC-type multidrug transport system ATPase subunit/ABC-type multidrug transport system permease subunit
MSKYNNLSHLGSLDHLGLPTEKTISIPRPVLVHERRHSSSGVPSQEQSIRHPIVIVRDAVKSYGRGAGCKNVLNNLNMTVRRGDIYGLLGASGCGKTSLLSMLVGRRVVDSGMIQVMGGKPGDRSCGIPGRKVGYMPQELALYTEFTIRETYQYFGRIYKMSSKDILIQMEFLTSLLDLPPSHRTIGTLSGGQQRRVSFAISLLHNPELMILDEPTVGVDPMLRQNIWKHLLHLSQVNNKTIIITTHYIEEARQANMVGFMRAGRLLAEERPGSLLTKYGLESLEDVFLRLCMTDSSADKENWHTLPLPDTHSIRSPWEEESSCGPSLTNLWALLVKNVLKLKRNLPMLLFIFLLPAVQVLFFCVAIGQEPTGLRLGLVNRELHSTGSTECPVVVGNCSYASLGCRVFRGGGDTVQLLEYNSEEEGLADVEDGDLWGLIVIHSNFSRVFAEGLVSPDKSVPGGGVGVRLDMSNQQVGLTIQQWLLQSVQNFTSSLLEGCGQDYVAPGPVTFQDPVYGEKDPSFTEFMAPGIIILIIYFLAVALTGEAFIIERASGLLDRSWIAGVRPSEILASHILVQFCVMMVQTTVTLATILVVFGIPCRGPLEWLAVITMLQGLAGMSFGFLISSLCDSQAVAMQLSIGSFYPNLLLSGILWPLEGMPAYLRVVARFLPNTLACQAMRDIMLRGWGIDREEVYLGVISSSIWILIFLTLSWLVVRVKS